MTGIPTHSFVAPNEVTVTEVCPRDGFQRFPRFIPTADKIEIVHTLVDAGFRSIEVTSFAEPERVPNLADGEEVMAAITRKDEVDYRVLVPHHQYAKQAVLSGATTIVPVVIATESYSHSYLGRSVAQVVDTALEVLALGREHDVTIDVAVGFTFFDPKEGDTPPERVEAIVEKLVAGGMTKMHVATSSGMGNPKGVFELCRRLFDRWPDLEIAFHIHDTNGMGLANALSAMHAGVRRFEGSICGLGGGIAMPHGMTVGNIASEDLVHFFDEMGIVTGLDVDRVVEASHTVARILGITPLSRAAMGGRKKDVLALAAST
jgi:hydroxymethylglutaryl-CoA lyase